ncbi:hypothetical protein RT717_03690 [Imperialibacter roseus]|uniref:Uncharacterized protein n=1 Tax=Imperialibacter roseus TaxID=1324217 RepID=A0ABZ0IRS2_9BACT|nr:hypothetical protein [Imperialibacter roseus]WOK07725.1 hypothetical protein RT717_03690 [Imperialibacter roseus]
MEGFALSPDGKVPRKMAAQYGREFTLAERVKYKIFGIGFFKPIEGQPNVLSRWFEIRSFTIRPHLDQLTGGLIFRLTGSKTMDALAIRYDEIIQIQVTREPDKVSPITFSPFWFLLQLGFKPQQVRWFTIGRRLEFQFGSIQVTIVLNGNDPIQLVWDARHEPSVRQFIGSGFLADKLDEKKANTGL